MNSLSACVLKFIDKEPETKTTATKSTAKISSVAERLISSRDCTRKYDISRLRIIYHCNSVFDLVKLEAISTFSEKLELCKRKEFDYKVSLLS